MWVFYHIKLIANWWAWERCLRDGGAVILALSRECMFPCNPESGNRLALSHWQSQWRYLPPHILTITNEREGGDGAKALNRHEWRSKQTAHSHTAGRKKTQVLQNPVWDPTNHDRRKRQLTGIGSTQTLPKLHVATFNIELQLLLNLKNPFRRLRKLRYGSLDIELYPWLSFKPRKML